MSAAEDLNASDKKAPAEIYLDELKARHPGFVYLHTVVHRKTAKLEFTGNMEELSQKIAEVFGYPAEALKHMVTDLESIREREKGFWMQAEEAIKPYKEKLLANGNEPVSKFEELYHVGRFLVELGEMLTLVVERKNEVHPDFIATDGKKIIGIEHTRLVDTSTVARHQRCVKYVKEAEAIVKKKRPDFIGIVNIWFNYRIPEQHGYAFTTKRFWQVIPTIIAQYVESVLDGKETIKPIFIERVLFSPTEENDLSLIKGEDYETPDNLKGSIKKAITTKEGKFKNYTELSDINECWLLIVIDGEKDYSAFDLKYFIPDTIESSPFKRIYLFENFARQLILLYAL